MAVRYGRQHPPDFGRSATWVESVGLPEVDEASTRFLAEIGYDGLVEIEYKYDARDATYRLLDVNARTWGYHALGSKLGVDFPLMLYDHVLGQSAAPKTARPGIGWVRLVTDLPATATALLHGKLSFRDYVRSMIHVRCESVFSASDPASLADGSGAPAPPLCLHGPGAPGAWRRRSAWLIAMSSLSAPVLTGSALLLFSEGPGSMWPCSGS